MFAASRFYVKLVERANPKAFFYLMHLNITKSSYTY